MDQIFRRELRFNRCQTCIKIILLNISIFISNIGLAFNDELCGKVINVVGDHEVEKIILKSESHYPLPRDPFNLQQFDIDDAIFLEQVEDAASFSWKDFLNIPSDPNNTRIQNQNIHICLSKFSSTNMRSSASLFLVVHDCKNYTVWKHNNLISKK